MTSTARDIERLLSQIESFRDSWRANVNSSIDFVPAARDAYKVCADALTMMLEEFQNRGTVPMRPTVTIDSCEAAIAEAERNLGDSDMRLRAMELTLIFIRELIQLDDHASPSTRTIADPLIGRAVDAGVPKVAATG